MDELTNEKILADLKSFRTIVDSDDIRIKNTIKTKIRSNPYIKYVLSRSSDEEKTWDDLFENNIFPYYAVFDTQTDVDNFLCFETSYDELQRYNKCFKLQQIIFYILCHSRSVNDEALGMATHDVLAALLIDQFDYTTIFGSRIHLVSDKPGLVDSRYVSRTLIFESITDNNLARTVDGVPRLINKQRDILVDDESIRNKNPKS